MPIRQSDLITGVETSTAPTVSAPTNPEDLVTKDYGDTTYAKLAYWGDVTASNAALKAVAPADRGDGQVRLNQGADALYQFDSGSAAADDGDLVLQPNTGSGRWLKLTSGGVGGSGSASGLSDLIQKVNAEIYGVQTPRLDNSASLSGADNPAQFQFSAKLLEAYTGSGTTIRLAFNPKFVNDSDKNLDSTTGWTAVNAGVTLTTSGTAKIGSNSLSFDKDSSATEAGIRYDQGSQIFSASNNYKVYFFVNLPSITNLSDIYLKMYGASTSDYRKWTVSVDDLGASLAVGWNLVEFDLSNTTGTTTGGAGWTYTELSRYQELGVDTSSAGQTYTAILIDSLMFGFGAESRINIAGRQYTIYDNSNRDLIKFTTGSNLQGSCTLAAAISNTYAGGDGSSNGLIVRSTFEKSGDTLVMKNGLSGTIPDTQEMLISKYLRESLNGTLNAFIDCDTQQKHLVTAVGGSTIDVQDPGDLSADWLNTDSLHVFRPIYREGEFDGFEYIGDKTLTANSTHSSGTTTLTITVTSVQVGDWVVKKHFTAKSSMVATATAESFTTMNEKASPNGVIMMGDSIPYPYASSIVGHYELGGVNQTLALRNLKGSMASMTKNGSVLFEGEFMRGKYAAHNFASTSDSLEIDSTSAEALEPGVGGTMIQASIWFKAPAFTGTNRWIFQKLTGSFEGYGLYLHSASNNVYFYSANAGAVISDNRSGAFIPNEWNHVFIVGVNSTSSKLYVNGALVSSLTSGSAFPAVDTNLSVQFGIDRVASTSLGATAQVAQVIFWKNGTELTQSQISQIANNRIFRQVGEFPSSLRYQWELTSQAGQQLALAVTGSRHTDTVIPSIQSMGILKV